MPKHLLEYHSWTRRDESTAAFSLSDQHAAMVALAKPSLEAILHLPVLTVIFVLFYRYQTWLTLSVVYMAF